MNEILDILQREFVYIWYYFDVQLRQIIGYWVLGIRYPAGNRAGKPSGNCLSFMYVWHDPPGGLFFQKWDER